MALVSRGSLWKRVGCSIMDLRSLVVGAACGAVVGVAAGWIVGNDNEKSLPVEAKHESGVETVPTSVSVDSNMSKQDEMEPMDSTVGDHSSVQTAGREAIDSIIPWPENQWRKAELEPKDDAWAYYMEQTLLQFLGSHASTAQFDISRIECRTTMCQLEVIGYDASSEPVWQQVIYDIRGQPWSDFGQYATSSGNVDGRLVLLGTIWRLPTPD